MRMKIMFRAPCRLEEVISARKLIEEYELNISQLRASVLKECHHNTELATRVRTRLYDILLRLK